METGVKNFINTIKDKTDISLTVFTNDGEFVAGNDKIIFNVSTGFSDIYLDGVSGNTFFKINYKNKQLIGCIEGNSDIQKNYALLISEICENYFLKETGFSIFEFYKAILLGEINFSQYNKYLSKFNIPKEPCLAILVNVETGNGKDVLNLIKNYTNDSHDIVLDMTETQFIYIKYVDALSEEYRSFNEFADYLYQSVLEELGAEVQIFVGGTVRSTYDLTSSYNQAINTLSMSKSLNAKGNIHTFKEFFLTNMLRELPKYKLNEYMDALMDENAKEIFDDEEMINTAEEFLEHSLNVSETARVLYLHRNTLTYRLDKIEKETGLNIRKFSDAVTFRLITLLSKTLK